MQLHAEVQKCIDICMRCYETCKREAMNHCLEAGGNHVESDHFRLMLTCAEVCRTTADVMLSGSDLHGHLCAACAEFCASCALSCEQLGDMQACAQVCRECERSCRRMTGQQQAM